jgi:tetratricopeptide (TPR) repeat protein/tRNA A-37 threonylcarbamoyl transferase component Bud32
LADVPERLRAALAGAYLVEKEVGAGGMATVYLAQDLKHNRRVALKVLHPGLAHALGPERFRREIEIAAQLQHPHILPVFDSGEHDGMLWYTMPFIQGESLRDLMAREAELPLEQAVQITREVAGALDCAHAQGIIHRDIKPENILLSGGHALVADFGIARALSEESGRLTATGLAIGTPAYMSPEQGEGARQVEARSDVYSLASVTYEMLTGEPPYAGATARAVMTKRLTDPIPSARRLRRTIPEPLDRAIMRGLAPTPADRFPTAGEFARALSGGTAPAPRAPVRTGRRLGLAALAVAALGVVVVLLPGRAGAPPAAESEYLTRGNHLLATRTPKAVGDAIAAYQAALAVDSTNATALARIGYGYTLFADWGWEYPGLTTPEVRARAMDYSQRALARDSTSAAAWLTRAYLLSVNDPYHLRGAVEAFTRSLALDSASAEGWYQFGQSLMVLGRSEEAAAAYRRAFALDPNRPMALMSLSALSLRAGRIAEARALIDSALQSSLTVTSPYVRVVKGMMSLAAGEVDAAQDEAELALTLDTAYSAPARSLLAMVYAAKGDRNRASREIRKAMVDLPEGDVAPTEVRFIAVALVALGLKEQALALIERARPRGATLWFYLTATGFDPIRSEPRFQRVFAEADPTR